MYNKMNKIIRSVYVYNCKKIIIEEFVEETISDHFKLEKPSPRN